MHILLVINRLHFRLMCQYINIQINLQNTNVGIYTCLNIVTIISVCLLYALKQWVKPLIDNHYESNAT